MEHLDTVGSIAYIRIIKNAKGMKMTRRKSFGRPVLATDTKIRKIRLADAKMYDMT